MQYACGDYRALLSKHEIVGSMSRKGNPYDNAAMESFFKTIKYDEVYLYEYQTLEDVIKRVPNFLEVVYNTKRLHSSLDYRTPSEVEEEFFNPCGILNHPTFLSSLVGAVHRVDGTI